MIETVKEQRFDLTDAVNRWRDASATERDDILSRCKPMIESMARAKALLLDSYRKTGQETYNAQSK